MKALEDGPPAVAAGFGVRQTGACRTRHGLRGRRYAVSSLELVGRGGLGRRLLDGLRELEVVCPITLAAQVVGILIVKEGLIVAFIVDAFLSQFEDNRALCEDENIASLDQSRAGEGFRIIASKRSSKDDIYRAMFLEDDD